MNPKVQTKANSERNDQYVTEEYKWIFHRLFKHFSLPPIYVSFFTASMLYVIGWVISYLYRFDDLYVNTHLFRHLTLAIWLALLTIAMGRIELYKSLLKIRKCFIITDGEYLRYINDWYSDLFKSKGPIVIWSFIASLIIWAIISLFYPYPLITNILDHLRIMPFTTILDSEWFLEPKLPKMLMLTLFLWFGAVPLSLGLWGGYRFPIFMRRLETFQVVPIPSLLLIALRIPTELFLSVSFVWFILTVSTSFVLFTTINIASGLIISAIASVGLVLFFVPQYSFHTLLIKSYLRLSELSADVYSDLYVNDENKKGVKDYKKNKLSFCVDTSEKIRPVNLWVFDISDILLLILGQLFSLAGLIWQSLRP
jgi:hypothetical protein